MLHFLPCWLCQPQQRLISLPWPLSARAVQVAAEPAKVLLAIKKDEFSEGRAMNRRAFLKKAATTGGALAAAGLLGNQSKALQSIGAGPQGGRPPNILFILVDELRYPRVFPQGVDDAGAFLRRFMPNTYALWLQ